MLLVNHHLPASCSSGVYIRIIGLCASCGMSTYVNSPLSASSASLVANAASTTSFPDARAASIAAMAADLMRHKGLLAICRFGAMRRRHRCKYVNLRDVDVRARGSEGSRMS